MMTNLSEILDIFSNQCTENISKIGTYMVFRFCSCVFTSSLIVMSHESNTFMFVLHKCLHATCICVDQGTRDQLNTTDVDMEKALLSCDVTTKVLVKEVYIN